jgi:hypothetical protein
MDRTRKHVQTGICKKCMEWVKALFVEEFLEFLAGAEKRKLFGLDTDLFSGFGIAASVAFIFLDLETTESSDLDPIAL